MTASGVPRHVWVDGRIRSADEPHLSVFDRGFQLGDGVFETLRAHGGRPTELAEHVARLHRSTDGLDIPLPADIDERLAEGITQLLAEEGVFDRGLRFRSMVLPDSFIQQDSPEKMYAVAAMNAGDIEAKVLAVLGVAQVGARRA